MMVCSQIKITCPVKKQTNKQKTTNNEKLKGGRKKKKQITDKGPQEVLMKEMKE